MKRLLAFAFSMLPLLSMAQNFNEDGGKYEVYCDVKYTVALKERIDITINNEEYKIVNRDGDIIKTKEGTETLNLLSKRGWKLVTTSQSQSGTSGVTVIHYIMMKEVTNDSEIAFGIAKEK